ncbi:MAG TPA: MFS transporter [Trichocoleus sp.]
MNSNSEPSSFQRLHRNRSLIVLLIAGSLAVMPGAVIAPVLPKIVQQLQLSKTLAGYLVSAHYLTVALFSPLLGILADRIGRRRVLIGSLIAFAGSGIAGAWAESFLPMLLTRGFLGIATGGIAAASLGLLARMYTDEQARSQAIAYASSTLTLANIAYPLFAGLAGAQNWQTAFYLYGLGIPLALLVALFLQENPLPSEADSIGTAIADNRKQLSQVLLQQPQVLRLLLTLGLASATAYATVIYLPLYLTATLNTATLTNGLVLASQAIGAALISALGVSWLARRFGSVSTIIIGLGIMALTLLLIPEIRSLQFLFPITLLFGVGLGIAMPSHYAALATLAPLSLQASILAIATGVNFLGQFLSPTLFGVVIHMGGVVSVFYAAAIVALATGIFLMVTERSA